MSEITKIIEDFPAATAITFDDVFRFCGNNCIGRHIYQPFIDEHNDAGRCLVAIMEGVGLDDYVPGNLYIACQKYGMKYPEYRAAVDLLSKTLAEKRPNGFENSEDAIAFWKFCINNSFELFDSLFEKGATDDLS